MKCKKHPCDLSSNVGVCASCLRDRLSSIVAAQSRLSQQYSCSAVDGSRNSHSQPQPPPLVFPRSVSPYVARRKSDDIPSWSSDHRLRFYSTPQLGPTYNSTSATFANPTSYAKKSRRFSLLSILFRSRSEKLNPDPSRVSSAPSPSSQSWFSTILSSGRRKKQSRLFSMEHSGGAGSGPHRRTTDRGMSPVRGPDYDAGCEDCDRSPSGSGCSSDSSQGWKKTPVAATRRGKPGHARNVSGLGFCLSPLVRASPNQQWSQKGGDMGEVRVPLKPHLSTAASYCANRSRKLADFGRPNRNR